MSEADRELIERLTAFVGVSATELARRAGLTPSTLTRPLNQPVKHRLSAPTMDKLRAAAPEFPGWKEQFNATPPSNARVVEFAGVPVEQPATDLPVWGSALGSARFFDGDAVEQTDLNSGSVLEYVRRPSILKGRGEAYGLHIQGSSMHPALPDGEMVVVCRNMPLSVGDNVVVYLRNREEDDGERARGVLVKELVRRSASFVELRQYEPRIDFRVSMGDVIRIDRILTRREMVS